MPYGDVDADATGGFAGGGASGPGGPGGAGGLGTGTAEAVGNLADALADALAGAQVDTFGSYAAEDVAAEEAQGGYSPGEQERMDAAAAAEERQALADRIAQIDAAIAGSTAAGSAGPGTTAASSDPNAPSAFVDDFSQIQRQAEVDVGAQDFANMPSDQYGFTPEEQERFFPGAQPTAGTDFFGGSPTAPSVFSSTAGGTPGFAMPGVGTGVEDFTGGGMPQAAPVGIEEMEMGMAAPMGSGGMLSQGGTFDPNMPESPGTGAITAGTGPGPTEGTINEWSGLDVPGTTQPGATTAAYDAGTPVGTATGTAEGQVELPSGVQDQIQRIPGDTTVTQLETGTPEYHAAQKQHIDKSIMQASQGLDQKAKEMREKHGLFSKEYQKAQRLANAFKSLDQYSKAYGATQGGSWLGNLLSGAMPFGAAVQAMNGWLQSKGMYNKQTGADLRGILEKAMAEGNLDSVMRDLQGGGPSDEDVQGPKEIKSFIEQYPWAAELDPKYIKYLIDNPAELQDLLGQGPNNTASTPMTAPNLAANEYPPGFPGMDNLPANWQDEGYTWKDPNNPNLSYSIIA